CRKPLANLPPMNTCRHVAIGALLAAIGFGASAAHAQTSEIVAAVADSRGKPVADAVVVAVPVEANVRIVARMRDAVVDQVGKEFVPRVMAIFVGTTVTFPNHDNVRHHVYSFSPAKRFELPLYSGVPAQPVVFDKPGVVVLGCNIHDWMIAYVAVLPTPYFQVTRQDGRAVLKDLPAGQYTVQVWHPALKGQPEALAQRVEVGGGTKSLQFTLPLKHDVRAKRAPGLTSGGYR